MIAMSILYVATNYKKIIKSLIQLVKRGKIEGISQ